MRRRFYKSALAATVSACALAGCTTLYNPATGQEERILINTENEIAIGRSVQKQVEEQEPLSEDPDMAAYVNRLGLAVANVSDRPVLPYEFKVIDKDEINAFMCPGGFCYVYRGVVEKMDEQELAFVLGHEVGHACARHSVKRIQAYYGYGLLAALAGLLIEDAADYDRMRQIADTAYQLIALGYSREDEFLADRLGMKYAYRAGYDPAASISGFRKLQESSGPDYTPVFLRSHPPIPERIEQAEIESERLKSQPSEMTF